MFVVDGSPDTQTTPTESLRKFTEDKFKVDEEAVETLKEDTNEQIDFMFRKNDELLDYVKKVETTSKDFRKKYSEDMAQVTLCDLIPGLKAEDVVPDTDENPINSDPKVNPVCSEARMFTIDQIQHLFHVLLRRSKVRSRVTDEEDKVRIL